MDLRQYYIQLGGRVSGPFTTAELVARTKLGQFARHFMVSTDKVHWESAAQHPEFFPGSEGFVTARPELTGQEWFYAKHGQETGPISRTQLFSMISSGQIGPNDQVWTEGMLAWEEVWMVPRLAALVGDALLADGSPLVLDAPARRYSGMAIASLVFAVLGMTILLLLGSLIAVVLGHKALREIDESRGWLTGRKAAVAGLTMGYITLIPGSVALFIFSVFILAYATRVPEPAPDKIPQMSNPEIQGARPFETKAPDPAPQKRRPVGSDARLGGVKGESESPHVPAGMESGCRRGFHLGLLGGPDTLWSSLSGPIPSSILCSHEGNRPPHQEPRLGIQLADKGRCVFKRQGAESEPAGGIDLHPGLFKSGGKAGQCLLNEAV